MTTICNVEGCDKPRYKKSRMCSMHIARKYRHGDVHHDGNATARAKMLKAFWAKVDKSGPCWLWTGELNRSGYGVFHSTTIDVPSRSAHRVSWLLTGQPTIPAGMHLDHLCRVVNCVNPAHLEIVTPQENVLRGISPAAQNAKKTHCPTCGGEYVIALRGHRKPGRWCPPCHSERRRQRKRERRALLEPDCPYQTPTEPAATEGQAR